jgi:magnesium-transporting ATPase (P-type)
MSRRARQPGGSIISRRALGFVLVVSLLIGGATLAVFYTVAAAGLDLAYARTEAVAMHARGQLAYLLNCRFLARSSITRDVLRGNPVIWWSAAALIGLQLVYTYVPFMNELFGSRPLAAWSWILPVVLSVGVFFAVELLKLVRRRGDAA